MLVSFYGRRFRIQASADLRRDVLPAWSFRLVYYAAVRAMVGQICETNYSLGWMGVRFFGSSGCVFRFELVDFGIFGNVRLRSSGDLFGVRCKVRLMRMKIFIWTMNFNKILI